MPEKEVMYRSIVILFMLLLTGTIVRSAVKLWMESPPSLTSEDEARLAVECLSIIERVTAGTVDPRSATIPRDAVADLPLVSQLKPRRILLLDRETATEREATAEADERYWIILQVTRSVAYTFAHDAEREAWILRLSYREGGRTEELVVLPVAVEHHSNPPE